MAADGFAALSDYDTNHDSVINASDANFNNIKVLKGDGTLLTMAQAGIASLSLNHVVTNVTDAQGNNQLALGSYTNTHGKTFCMADYSLKANTVDSIALTPSIAIPTDVAALPNIQGFGNVYDLQQAMAMDISGQLKPLVQSFIQSTNTTQQNQLLDQILLKWTNTDPATVSDQH